MKKIFFYQTDIGKLGIVEKENKITNVYFDGEEVPEDTVLIETDLLKEAGCQLHTYFEGKQQTFDLPLSPEGTAFMQSVWNSLCEVPYGETRSYKEIARSIGNEKACRAVGLANNRNPIPIFIPCHRVIGANGKLTGYAGGLQVKEHLLQLEKQYGDV